LGSWHSTTELPPLILNTNEVIFTTNTLNDATAGCIVRRDSAEYNTL